jgi:hypothetical protein
LRLIATQILAENGNREASRIVTGDAHEKNSRKIRVSNLRLDRCQQHTHGRA